MSEPIGPGAAPPSDPLKAAVAAVIAAWRDGERFIVIDVETTHAAAMTAEQIGRFGHWFPNGITD